MSKWVSEGHGGGLARLGPAWLHLQPENVSVEVCAHCVLWLQSISQVGLGELCSPSGLSDVLALFSLCCQLCCQPVPISLVWAWLCLALTLGSLGSEAHSTPAGSALGR